MLQGNAITIFLSFLLFGSSHGRVVKASDSKSDVIFTRSFESCWLRLPRVAVADF